MCGIVAYVGHQDAYPILIEGLKRLEYRGYDSAGIALITDSKELQVYKTKAAANRHSSTTRSAKSFKGCTFHHSHPGTENFSMSRKSRNLTG